MQNDAHTPPPRTVAHIAIFIAYIIAVFAVGFGVIVLLKSAAPQPSIVKPSSLSAAEITKEYAKPDAVKALSSNDYTAQADQTTDGTVIYRSSTASYIINAPAKNHVLFAGKKPMTKDDTPTVQEQTTAFMKDKGFEKAGNVGTARSQNPSHATYQNDKAVCVLTSTKTVEGSNLPPYHELACADKTSIQDEYAATDKLLALYKNAGGNAPFTEVARQTKTEGNKALSIVSLINNEQSTALLFASVDNQWAYIGNLNDNSGVSNGKYAVSDQVRQAVADPKYGDFLTKNIQL
ncbi:MAG TPA: hypothetical protein VFH06_04670 [Candidatus Saccharimonadales bacterium]|nr:hypothetical protein [Candidatus Saccharimonadales bacterium]